MLIGFKTPFAFVKAGRSSLKYPTIATIAIAVKNIHIAIHFVFDSF